MRSERTIPRALTAVMARMKKQPSSTLAVRLSASVLKKLSSAPPVSVPRKR
jgi:hypothetical protein